MRTRIICLGNTVMTDDGAAIHLARHLRERLGDPPEVDIVESAVAGYALLDMLPDWDRVVLVEAVKLEGHEPGEVLDLDPEGPQAQLRLFSSREEDLPTMMKIGRKLGRAMPDEVILLGIQGDVMCEFGEELTAPVAAALPAIADMVMGRATA